MNSSTAIERCPVLTIVGISLLFLVMPATLMADTEFEDPECYSVGFGSNPYWTSICDVDLDGHLDLTVACSNTWVISVLIGKGDGTFYPEQRYDVDPGPVGVVTPRLNEDEFPDAAVCNSSGSVGVLLNNGDGTFGEATIYTTGAFSQGIDAADFDEDGDIDLAVANEKDDNLTILFNDGEGGFPSKTYISSGDGPHSMLAVHLNEDDHWDLVHTNWNSGDLSVLIGNGDGTFQSPVHYYAGPHANEASAADFDRDGDMDVVACVWPGFAVFMNEGDGTLEPPVLYTEPGEGMGVGTADLDKDTYADVMFCSWYRNVLSIFYNDGDGTFGEEHAYDTPAYPRNAAAGDLDEDGHLDIVETNHDGWSVCVLINMAGDSLEVSIEPRGSINVPRGDSLRFTASIKNWTDHSLAFDAWLAVRLLGGKEKHLQGPVHVYLGAGKEISQDRALYVPSRTPIGGPFTLIIRGGDYPDDIWSEDSFEFYVVPPED